MFRLKGVAPFSRLFSTFGSKGHTHELTFTGGKKMVFNTGKMARLADGASVVQAGDTAVLATVVGKSVLSPKGFFPLTVEYRQRAAAAGRIPTNFLRRELAPSSQEILTGRLIDRAIRPLFSASAPLDTQVVCTLLSADSDNEPDIMAVNAASMAIAVSDIPWSSENIIGAIRVGKIGGQFVVNPTRSELKTSSVNLIVAANSMGNIVMLEGGAEELPVADFIAALEFGSSEASKVAKSLVDMQSSVGKVKRTISLAPTPDKDMVDSIYSLASLKLREIFSNGTHDKLSRDGAVNALREEVLSSQNPSTPGSQLLLNDAFSLVTKKIFRRQILDKNLRCDGRSLEDLRPLNCEVDVFSPLHGSAIFQRGQSQVFATVTLDSHDAAFRPDPAAALMLGFKEKNFMLHYEFPGFATSELGRPGTSRREIGHGALAERSLRPVVPSDYPFTIRVSAEVLESNGSTSMGAACAGSLAMMDAGVPLARSNHVAGVAIGLVSEEPNEKSGKYVLLTDQIGIEDYMGDMDFKIAGTRSGITGLQADTKLSMGLPLGVAIEAVNRGVSAIHRTIDVMCKAIPAPRSERKPWAPVSGQFSLPSNRRSQIIGLGGSNLRKLCSETGVTMSTIDDCTFEVFAPNPKAMSEAKDKFDQMVKAADEAAAQPSDQALDFGAIYKVRIVEIRDYGVLVELPKSIAPNMTPVLIHNSQLDSRKISHPSAIGLEVGQEIKVKYFGRDPATGNIRLSRKVLFVGVSR